MQGERPAKATEQQPAAAAVLPVQWRSVSRGLMVHQLPVGGVAAGRDRMTAVKGTRVEISRREILPPLTDGKPNGKERGFRLRGVGRSPLHLKGTLRLRKNKYNKKP